MKKHLFVFSSTFLLVSAYANATDIPESCSLNGKKAVLEASRKGYQFEYSTSSIGGNASCSVLEQGEVLIVSAALDAEGTCSFSLFVPPPNAKSSPIIRVAVRSKDDGTTQYIQKSDNADGFSIKLKAGKGQTSEYRIVNIEVSPVAHKCDEEKIGAQL